MEKRVLLAIVLSILVLVLWERYFVPKRQPPPPSTSPEVEQAAPSPAKPGTLQPEPPQAPVSSAPAPLVPSLPPPAAPAGRDVVVDTPLYRAVFTETGARLKSFVLKNYRESIDKNSPGKELVTREMEIEGRSVEEAMKTASQRLNLAPDQLETTIISRPSSGFFGIGARNAKIKVSLDQSRVEDLPLAFDFVNHPVAALNLAPYVADQTEVKFSSGENKTLTFTYEAPGWLRITREYLFHPDSYLIDLTVRVENLGSQPWENAPILSLINLPFSAGGSSRYSFQGPALLVNDELQEVKVGKIKGEEQLAGPIDWIGYTNQYFTMAAVPQSLAPNHARLKPLYASTNMVETTFIGPKITLRPGSQQELRFKLYLGPKEVKNLKAADPQLAKAVNFGWFDVIAQPLLVCLKFFYRYLHNYGLAIILLTVLIKILFWWPSKKSYTSMQAMKKLQPKMQKIREKYKNDREKMNQEVMQLYRTHKVNPASGCWPMILQIPVFFALYRVLYSSITMRHAPFVGWINDLSAPDRLSVGFHIPYLGGLPVLTLLMGLSMYIQQKMTPTAGDPRQEKLMLYMPIFFTFIFVTFPSGLVLYWLVNNILSIGQQYYITKKTA